MWINGPFCCGRWPDVKIAKKGIIKKFAREMAIADSGYRSLRHYFVTPSGYNNLLEREHAVIRARHETANGRFKTWNILKMTFRHDVRQHGFVFWAIANIVQIEISTTRPLFDIQIVFDESVLRDNVFLGISTNAYAIFPPRVRRVAPRKQKTPFGT